MPVATELPRWDLDSIYPGFSSPEYKSALESLKRQIDNLQTQFDEEGIGAGDPLGADTADLFEELAREIDKANELAKMLRTYVNCTVDMDSRNDEAQAQESALDELFVPLEKLSTRFTSWLGRLPICEVVERSAYAKEHEYFLQKAATKARHLMSPEEEELASDLNVTGAKAWGKLHNDITSQIEAVVEIEGQPKTLSMSMIRSLSSDPNRSTRRAGYEAEMASWKISEVPLAAAMNSIKGQVGVISRRRLWSSPLEEALFEANMDRQALDAMMSSAHKSFPAFRRYMKSKAKALGLSGLEWYDMFAPVGESTRQWDYDEACDFVASQFDTFSSKMGDFARRAFKENWIDVPPMPGKSDGAYCSGVRKDESRILLNFKPSFSWVKTHAHELGHAYHNLCLSGRTSFQRRTPMTLAETASIFCETIVQKAAFKVASADDQITILDGTLQAACQVVVDITSRFEFEQSVFDARRNRALSASEFCELMLEAQRNTYGDGLVSYHPYMWAVKPHYYATRSFYNFPYMFGLLFALGLYARYEADPSTFRSSYDDLLSSTGLADAATLADRFGIDIRSEEFWAGSLSVIEEDINLLEQRLS